MTRRRPCPVAPGPLEGYAARFDDLFTRVAQRRGFRGYLAGLLAPRERNKTLTALASAPFPVTVIWGLYDTVSPPRVASYVWNQYLMLKPGGNRLYFIPDANHYLQADRPDAFVKVLLHALGPADDHGPGPLGPEPGAPLLVDTSRERLPAAAGLLRADDPARTN